MSPVADETQYISAKEVRNKRKNRYSNILPGVHTIICLAYIKYQFITYNFIKRIKRF